MEIKGEAGERERDRQRQGQGKGEAFRVSGLRASGLDL